MQWFTLEDASIQGSNDQTPCGWMVQNSSVSMWAAVQGEEENTDRDPTQLLRAEQRGV